MKNSYEVAVALYEEAVYGGAPADVCQCCGAHIAEGLKGCFELFAALGERGYSDPRFARPYFYGVDAHALQHPEIHGKKNNAAHLLRLHWIFTTNAHDQADTVPRWWQRYLSNNEVPVLAVPPTRGALTVVDVAAEQKPERYAALMCQWAEVVYQAWAPHHGWAERELAKIFTQ